MWEKAGWVIPESEKTRELCGHVFFLQRLLPTNPLPMSGRASAERLGVWRRAERCCWADREEWSGLEDKRREKLEIQ